MIRVESTQEIEINDNLLNMAIHLSYVISKEEKTFPKMEKKEACLEGRNFLEALFSLHPVQYCPTKEIEAFFFEDHTQEEIVEFLQNAKRISPFKIPIAFITEPRDGKLIEYHPLSKSNNELETIFSGILLEKEPTVITPASYLHEIVHSQIDRSRKTITDSNNRGVLSIFLELVFLAERRSQEYLEAIIKEHYQLLNKYINELYDFKYRKKREISKVDYEECSKYIISILRALNLFRKYQENAALRKYILKGIQCIFDKKTTLEQLLKINEVSEKKEIQFLMKL